MRVRHPLVATLLLAAACCLPIRAGNGAWTPLGPDGATVTVLAASQDRLLAFAGTYNGGIFRSTDGGRSWAAVNAGFGSAGAYAPVSTLALDPLRPSRVYAGTSFAGSYRSLDGGSTWSRNGEVLAGGATTPFHALLADPASASTIYAATDAGVFRSRDSGASWQPRGAGLPAGPARALVFDPAGQSLYVGLDQGGVYRSGDRGATWQRANAGLLKTSIVTQIAVDPRSPATLLAGSGSGLYRSLDRGRSWKRLAPNLAQDPLVGIAFQSSSERVYAATARGVLYSLDRGATWTPVPKAPEETTLASFAVGAATLYVASFDPSRAAGVEVSFDDGNSWRRSNRGLSTLGPLGLAFDPADPATFYTSTGETGLYVTHDAGATWARIAVDPAHPFARVAAIVVEPTVPTTLYAGSTALGPVARSDDGGATWQNASPESPSGGNGEVLASDPLVPGGLWAVGFGPPAHSTDGGRHWETVDIGTGLPWIRSIAIDGDDPRNVVFAGLDVIGTRPVRTQASVFGSEDGGLTWRNLSPATLPGSAVSQLAADPFDPALLYAATDLGLYSTRDAGATWRRRLDFQGRGGAVAATPQALYAVRNGAGALRSTDQGATWVPIRTGLGGRRVHQLWVDPRDPRHLFAGTENAGLYEYTEPQ